MVKGKRQILIQKRLEKGLTQRELAKRAGLGIITIFNIENGKMLRPSNIPKLAEAYGLSTAELVQILFAET